MFEKVLFATDFSAYAKKTLECIGGFPGAREVILLHVVEEIRSPRGGGQIDSALFHIGNNHLKEEKRHLERLGQHLRVTTEVKISSDIAAAIIQTAEERGVSLIIVGARGNSLVEGILLGSVSTAVLRHSRTSVLIMRHKITEEMKTKTYEMFCPMILTNVLCPVDFSPFTDLALSSLSSTDGVRRVILLHVVSRGETDAEINEGIHEAQGALETIRRNLAIQGIDTKIIIRTGNPASEITRIADEEDVSVIWMSSHGKGWFRDLLVGSTAYTVAMNATRPVIIVRKPETPVPNPQFSPP